MWTSECIPLGHTKVLPTTNAVFHTHWRYFTPPSHCHVTDIPVLMSVALSRDW
jgi:hypothetical protein